MLQAPQYDTNPYSGEPFLRLLPPHDSNIILTPLRDSDKEPVSIAMNDPRIYEWFAGPPVPYLPAHARAWSATIKRQDQAYFKEMRGLNSNIRSPSSSLVSGCPFRILREVQPDGTDVFLGDVSLFRQNFSHLPSPEKEMLAAKNNAKDIGDPTICWSFGGKLKTERCLLWIASQPSINQITFCLNITAVVSCPPPYLLS
jgi:hypothetical protein